MNTLRTSFYWPDGYPDDPLAYFEERLAEQERIRGTDGTGGQLLADIMSETRNIIKQLKEETNESIHRTSNNQ